MRAHPKDEPVAYDAKNRPIFGYREDGTPVCYSRLPGRPHIRCMSTVRMKNGRCSVHGGKSPVGPASARFREGKYAEKWEQGNRAQELLDAVKDPNYLSLRTEIGLSTVQISELLAQFEVGTDESHWRKIQKAAERLEKTVESDEMLVLIKAAAAINKDFEKFGPDLDALFFCIKHGSNQQKLWREINEAVDHRRKLVETEMKRNMLEQNHMKAEEVLFLFSQIVGLVKKIWKTDTANLTQFAYQLDTLSSLMPQNQSALQGTPGAKGIIEPRSALADGVRNQVDSEEAEFVTLEVHEEDED